MYKVTIFFRIKFVSGNLEGLESEQRIGFVNMTSSQDWFNGVQNNKMLDYKITSYQICFQ